MSEASTTTLTKTRRTVVTAMLSAIATILDRKSVV